MARLEDGVTPIILEDGKSVIVLVSWTIPVESDPDK